MQESAFFELKKHGINDFPYMVYNTKMPLYFKYYPLHWHDDFEILYIVEGKLNVRVQGKSYSCEPGDIVVIPPDYMHDMQMADESGCRYGNIIFKFELLEKDSESDIYKKYFAPFMLCDMPDCYLSKDNPLNKEIEPYVKELFETRHDKYTTDELRVKSDLYRIIFYIKNMLASDKSKIPMAEEWLERLKPVLSFVQNNLSCEMSVEQASDMCKSSKSHFMKMFKNLTGTSFVDYVKTCRLEYAYRLLIDTTKSIEDIGNECGFSNFSYFIRSFKSAYGSSPLQFRKEFEKMMNVKRTIEA